MLRRGFVLLALVAVGCAAPVAEPVSVGLNEPFEALEITTASGAITVLDLGHEGAWLRADLRYASIRPEIVRELVDGTLLLSHRCPGLIRRCRVTYTVRLDAIERLRLESGEGDLTIAGLSGQFTTISAAGDQQFDDLRGRLEAEAVNGRVRGTNLRLEVVEVNTGSGDVRLGLVTVPSEVVVTSGAGDVVVKVPAGQAYALTATTESGDIDIGVEQDDGSPSRIRIATGAGDITVVAVEPPKAAGSAEEPQ